MRAMTAQVRPIAAAKGVQSVKTVHTSAPKVRRNTKVSLWDRSTLVSIPLELFLISLSLLLTCGEDSLASISIGESASKDGCNDVSKEKRGQDDTLLGLVVAKFGPYYYNGHGHV